jgi:hypothetical protein
MAATMENMLRVMAQLTKEDFIELTSGSMSKETIRKIRPYRKTLSGRRGNYKARAEKVLGISSIPRLPINRHTRALQDGIVLDKVSQRVFRVYSTAPHAKFMTGTENMVDRGLFSSKTASGSNKLGELEKRYRSRLYMMREVFKRIRNR